MKSPYDIIISPVLTEKSYDQFPGKTYTFKVDKSANKIQIKQAVEEIFDVQVESVHTVNVDGKVRRQGASVGRTSSYKKAYVKLTEHSKGIEFFDSISQ
ncbi:MAG TPA: 50S ribosomal protein L23 [Eubacteriales bacterium]|nr:50S ribosomal protein L23 [Eubacteriales bacterium]